MSAEDSEDDFYDAVEDFSITAQPVEDGAHASANAPGMMDPMGSVHAMHTQHHAPLHALPTESPSRGQLELAAPPRSSATATAAATAAPAGTSAAHQHYKIDADTTPLSRSIDNRERNLPDFIKDVGGNATVDSMCALLPRSQHWKLCGVANKS